MANSRVPGDARIAFRQLRRSPAFAAAAILCLALGIGATTAIFSVVNAVVLRPLPYRQPEQLIRVYSEFPTLGAAGLRRFWISPPEFRDLRQLTQAFQTVDAWQSSGANIAGAGAEPVRVNSAFVSSSLLATLGVQPTMGRWIDARDCEPGAAMQLVLGYNLWRSSYGADPAILGKEIQYNGRPATVIGVMPRGFQFPPGEREPAEIWVPLQLTDEHLQRWGNHRLSILARRRPDLSQQQALQDLIRVQSIHEQQAGPRTHRFHSRNHPLVAYSLIDETVGSVRPAMLLMLAATALVLFIACGNVANLLLARAQARQREIAVRQALGARAASLTRQFLFEGLLLSLCGGALGLLFAWGGIRLILAFGSDSIPRASEVSLDPQVLAFALGASLLTGVVFGLTPLFQVLRSRIFHILKSSGGRTTATREAHLLRQSLVVGEMAFALVLLIGAGLLLQAFWKLSRQESGIREANTLSLRLVLPSSRYGPAEVTRFWNDVQQRAAHLPGVENATLLGGLPPLRQLDANDVSIEGYVPRPGMPAANVDYYQAIQPGGFEMLGIRLLEGRTFSASDGPGAPPVLIVNETFARTFFPGSSPLGRKVNAFGGGPALTVIGVVQDVRNAGFEKRPGTEIYFSLPQAGGNFRSASLLVRGPGDPWKLLPAVRSLIREMDSALPLSQVRPLEDAVGVVRAQPRFLALLLALFAAIAVGLAALGIFSVMSYAVAQRTNEFGVRMALGATASNIFALVLRGAVSLVFAGIVVGALGAFILRRTLQGLVFGIGAVDLLAWVLAPLLLLLIAVAASLAPARRATSVDPNHALRYE
ncbi:MAG: ABC transporter permease [Acidobacteria bacterium]|nr:ABC transporter permease [Acidobacteriota bacterium]